MPNNEAAELRFDYIEPMGNHPNELSRLMAETRKITKLLMESLRQGVRQREQIKQLIAEINQTKAEGGEVQVYTKQLFVLITKLKENNVGREFTEAEKTELYEEIVECE